MNDLKNVYDEVYTINQSYNFHYPAKDLIIDLYSSQVEGGILDAGCGQGENLKRLLNQGIDAFGVELSSVCCEKYLSGLPHKNSDIVSFSAQSTSRYGGIVCFDVLEHIPEDSLDENLQALSALSSSALLGIANHSDIQCGEELHLIQEGVEWWIARLSKFYKTAKFVVSFLSDTFFVIEVSNEELNGKTYISERYDQILAFADKYDKIWDQCSLQKSKNNELTIKTNELTIKTNELNNSILALRVEYEELKNKYSNIVTSKEIRIANRLRKLVGKPAWELLDNE